MEVADTSGAADFMVGVGERFMAVGVCMVVGFRGRWGGSVVVGMHRIMRGSMARQAGVLRVEGWGQMADRRSITGAVIEDERTGWATVSG
jgi:hypothetical protein